MQAHISANINSLLIGLLLLIIIIVINKAASSDADSSKDCETRGKCIFFTILERRVKEGKKSEESVLLKDTLTGN